ncbi:MAG: peptidylprolyl isomerase [Flavobacterium sp.]|jgi:cyclophilin family peptidyl-prolyl cis-trans isomerase|nr:peptidylprolyl isomerase [Flavobacterium sp.]
MKYKLIAFLFLGIISVQAQKLKKGLPAKKPAITQMANPKTTEGVFANILTTKGTIIVQLEYQKTPVTVANFVSLAEGKNTYVTDEKLKGKPFYNGLKFHRVLKDFMIQGGDPAGNGSGGPGYAFKDEFTDLKHNKGGILSMANSGPASNGSQFFITHKDTPWLDGVHTVFGHVTEGMDVVNKIEQNDLIIKITISRKGALASKFNAVKVFSDYYVNKVEEAKKQAAIEAENKAKQQAVQAENKRIYIEKYGNVIKEKAAYLAATKATATTTASGLQFVLLKKGTDIKPVDGSTIYFKYAGYFEDGNVFDTNYEEVAKTFGLFNQARADQNGYQAFPFEAGKKTGLIQGFIEGMGLMNIGDKILLFLPSKLAYGERGAGGVIPPNTSLVFELEITDKTVTTK